MCFMFCVVIHISVLTVCTRFFYVLCFVCFAVVDCVCVFHVLCSCPSWCLNVCMCFVPVCVLVGF